MVQNVNASNIWAGYRPMPENPVTMNDRMYSCGPGDCGQSIEYSGMHPGFEATDRSMKIVLEGYPIDVSQTRDNFYDQFRSLSDALKSFNRWIANREKRILMLYDIRVIERSAQLLANVQMVRKKIDEAKRIMKVWFGEYESLFMSAIYALEDYSKALNTIVTLSKTQSFDDTFKSSIVLSSKNSAKRKSVTKQFTKLMVAREKLESIVLQIEVNLESFRKGTIIVDNEMLDFHELVETIDSLTDQGTPLEKLDKILSEIFNVRETKITLGNKRNLDMTTSVEKNSFLNTIPKQTETMDEKINNLHKLNTSVLYTDNTKDQIEEYFRVIRENVTPAEDQQLLNVMNSIRQRTPQRVYNELSTDALQPGKIMATVYTLDNILDNINDNDISVRRTFSELRYSLKERWPQYVRTDAMYMVHEPTTSTVQPQLNTATTTTTNVPVTQQPLFQFTTSTQQSSQLPSQQQQQGGFQFGSAIPQQQFVQPQSQGYQFSDITQPQSFQFGGNMSQQPQQQQGFQFSGITQGQLEQPTQFTQSTTQSDVMDIGDQTLTTELQLGDTLQLDVPGTSTTTTTTTQEGETLSQADLDSIVDNITRT